MLAFAGVVMLGGVNGVGIGVLNNELAPIWGAAIRFGLASMLLIGLAIVRRARFPRRGALVGTVTYGFLYFGVGFGLIHWALADAPPGMTQVILSVVPLLALLLATAHGVEPFRRQGLAGALLAASGVAIVFGDRLGGELPVIVLLAILGGALGVAEGTVAVKRFPSGDPVTANAIAMIVATSILLATSMIAGEAWSLPATPGTWTALIYVVAVGSVVVFVMFLYVVSRWTASATSFVWPLFPLVAVPFSALILGESITPMLLLGAALVVIGVYVGAFAPPLGRPSAIFRQGAS